MLRGPARADLTRLLPGYLRARRWFRSKARRIKNVSLYDSIAIPLTGPDAVVAIFDVEFTEGEPERYVLPLALAPADRAAAFVNDAPQALVAHVIPVWRGSAAVDALRRHLRPALRVRRCSTRSARGSVSPAGAAK